MTPALDALLKEVDGNVGVTTSDSANVGYTARFAAKVALSNAAPRLAALLRVAVEAITDEVAGTCCCDEAYKCRGLTDPSCRWCDLATLRAALARIEAMAKGSP